MAFTLVAASCGSEADVSAGGGPVEDTPASGSETDAGGLGAGASDPNAADARLADPLAGDAGRADGARADGGRVDVAPDRPMTLDTRPDTGVLANECHSPCTEAPALVVEKQRLRAIGGNFLGICGDANHTSGYHVPAARLPASDYSMRGAANTPVCVYHACAIDIGMNWPAARTWLRWLIREIRERRITGVPEVIGSYDGVNVRYWSDSSGWSTDGIRYTGAGHDHWSHVSIHRSTALRDHRVLAGWTATTGP